MKHPCVGPESQAPARVQNLAIGLSGPFPVGLESKPSRYSLGLELSSRPGYLHDAVTVVRDRRRLRPIGPGRVHAVASRARCPVSTGRNQDPYRDCAGWKTTHAPVHWRALPDTPF